MSTPIQISLSGIPSLWAVLFSIAIAVPVRGQPGTPDPIKASALKLPDGTVVFWTKNPEEANPTVEGVILSPQDYKALLEQAELARKVKALTPSALAIRVKLEQRGDHIVAALNLTYSFRTTEVRSSISLGCQRGVLTAARSGQGKLPILNLPGEDGLALIVDSAGEQTAILDVEAPVFARGFKSELGFEVGLPKAAITTLAFDGPPALGIKSVMVGTRVADPATVAPLKPGEWKRVPHTIEPSPAKPVALGATDGLEVSWEPPTPAAPVGPSVRSLEIDAVVRVEETHLETVAKMRLRGNSAEWPLQLPPGADVLVERVRPPGVGPTAQPETTPPTVVRPGDPTKVMWLIRTPVGGAGGEWLVTATVRIPRPKPSDPKFRGPYTIGPFALLSDAKQTGRIAVSAGPSIRLSFKSPVELRRQDLPPASPDDLVANFTYSGSAVAKPTPWLEIDARGAPTAIRANAAHSLKLTPGGWKLETSVRIVPPPRGEMEQIIVEMPAEWPAVEAAPEELVESTHIVQEGAPRLLAIRFNSPQKSPFTLKIHSTRGVPPKADRPEEREARLSLAMPRFPQTEERETSVIATVPEGFEVRGSVSLWEGGQPSAATDPLAATPMVPNRPSAVVGVSGTFDRAVARVDLGWQHHKPPLVCENRVEVSLQTRQLLVQQVLKFKPGPDDKRPIRLKGPAALLGLQSVPALEPVGEGLWDFRPVGEGGKEFSLTASFALRMGGPSDDPALTLLWPESATRIDTLLRVWGGGTGRRVNGYGGDWRELPPDPATDRDVLPLLTLASSAPAPALTLDLGDLAESGLPAAWIDRTYLRVDVGEGAIAVQQKILLKRWIGPSLAIDLPRVDGVEISIDGKRIESVPNAVETERPDICSLAIPLPESKPNKGVLIELKYRYAGVRTPHRERLCIPPRIRGALYRTPMRWRIDSDRHTVALIASGQWDPDFRWGWSGFGFAPVAGDTREELDAWLHAGTDTDFGDAVPASADGHTATVGRQVAPEPIAVVLVPRSAWMAGWSAFFFLAGWTFSHLRKLWLGFALAVSGAGLAIAGVIAPQSLAQILAAMQPGAALLAVGLVGRSAWNHHRMRRLSRLPGFSRERQSASGTQPFAPATQGSGHGEVSPPVPASRSGTGSTVPPLRAGV